MRVISNQNHRLSGLKNENQNYSKHIKTQLRHQGSI